MAALAPRDCTALTRGQAAAWDSHPFIIGWTALAAQELPKVLAMRKEMTCMELGCGTGFLTKDIAPLVHEVLGVDNSPGMMREYRRKAEAHDNMHASCLLITGPGQLEEHNGAVKGVQEGFDLIYSNLTFHHIPEPLAVLNALKHYLKPGGVVAVLDFEGDGGEHGRSFHPEEKWGDVAFHGFVPGQLQAWMAEAGLEDAAEQRIFQLEKPIYGGASSAVFHGLLATARLPK